MWQKEPSVKRSIFGYLVFASIVYVFFMPAVNNRDIKKLDERVSKLESDTSAAVEIRTVTVQDTVAIVRYKSELKQLVQDLGHKDLVVTYARITDSKTAIGAKPSINALAVADKRLLGQVFWVENPPAWMPQVWVAIDSMPDKINGQAVNLNRADKYAWQIPRHGRDLFTISGVRTIKDMECIVLHYEGPTRRDLGK